MQRPFFALALLPVLAALLPLSASAQTACNGKPLTGTVQDSTAAVIPGATVRLDGSQSQTSGSDGRFRFACVADGHHHLSTSAPGFGLTQQDLSTPLSAEFHVTLVPADSISITVAADEPTTQPVLGGLNGGTISGEQLINLADDPDDLQRELQQLAASAGGPPSGTVISVDGFQDDSPLPPKSSIARVEVNPDLFSAENRQPPFEGGRIQIFTKPGAKNFHGTLFTTNSSQWMNARDPFSDAPAAIGKQRYGFTLNGPVRKEGSNFSLALEHRSIDEFAVVNAIDLDAAGNQTPLVANVPIPQRLWIGSARVDAQLGPKNIAFVSYSANVDHLANVGVGGTTLQAAGYDSQTYDHVLRFSDTTTFSPNLLHEARVSVDFRGEIDNPTSTAPQVQVAGAFTGGGANIGPQHIRQIRTEWDDDFIYTHGKHSIKAGLQIFDYAERQTLTTNFNGTYIFGGGTAPVLDASNNPTAATQTISGLEQYRRALLHLPGGTPTQYSSVAGNPQVDFTEFYPAFFVQDDIKVRPNVTLSAGLRYFCATLPFQDNGFTPRLGVSWTPGGSKTLSLNAHIGLFSGHSPNGLAFTEAELRREDGTDRVTSLVYNPVYGAPATTGSTVLHALRDVAPQLPEQPVHDGGAGRKQNAALRLQHLHQPHLHPRMGTGAHSQHQHAPQRLPHRPPARYPPTSTSCNCRAQPMRPEISNSPESATRSSKPSSSSSARSASISSPTPTTTPSSPRKAPPPTPASTAGKPATPCGRTSPTSPFTSPKKSSSPPPTTATATRPSTSPPASTTTAMATSTIAPSSRFPANPAPSPPPSAISSRPEAPACWHATSPACPGASTPTPTSSAPSPSPAIRKRTTSRPSPPMSAHPT